MILLCQNGIKQSCDLTAGDNFQRFCSFWAKAQFRADPQAIFVVCQSLIQWNRKPTSPLPLMLMEMNWS